MAYKGRFSPKNPHKYKGDASKIIYRSSYELKFFRYIDVHPEILWWASEEYIVPYKSPIDNRNRRYFPDVVLCKLEKDMTKQIYMIEIKPETQTGRPDIRKKNATPTGRISRRYLNEVKRYGINEAKWSAAEQYCAKRGWKWLIMTEKHLGIK